MSRITSFILLALLTGMVSACHHNECVAARVLHFGGSLTNNEEVIYSEEVNTDKACGATLFTQQLFGPAATVVAMNALNGPQNQVQVGPLDVNPEVVLNDYYRIQYARWNSTVLAALDPTGVIPNLEFQINQAFQLYGHGSNDPTLVTITAGANDAAAIFTVGVEAYESKVGSVGPVNAILYAQSVQAPLIAAVIASVNAQVLRLQARFPDVTIVIGNIPDLAKTPFFLNLLPPGIQAFFTPLLEPVINQINAGFLATSVTFHDVSYWDLHLLFANALAGSSGSYTTTPCGAAQGATSQTGPINGLCQLSPLCIFADNFHPSAALNYQGAYAPAPQGLIAILQAGTW